MINSTPGSNTIICSFLGRQRWENISHASFAGAALNDVLKEDSAAYEAQMGANRLKIDCADLAERRTCGAQISLLIIIIIDTTLTSR